MKIKRAIIVLMAPLMICASIVLLGGALQKGQNADVSRSDPGFVPSTGQINLGFDAKLPRSALAREIPSGADARAAFFASERLTYAFDHKETTGAASSEAEVIAPIGASPQTIPAKFSKDYTGEILQHQRYARPGSDHGLAVGAERPAASAYLPGSYGRQERAGDRHQRSRAHERIADSGRTE